MPLIPFFRQSPFRTFRRKRQPSNYLTKSSKWRLSKKGMSGIRLPQTKIFEEQRWVADFRLTSGIFVWGRHKVVTKDHSIPEESTHHITVATIFCNHLAKLLQKKVASPKTQPNQPSATHPHFGQTCLFTNSPNISTTVRGSKFQGIREKAGLSKMGVSCRRLNPTHRFACYYLL